MGIQPMNRYQLRFWIFSGSALFWLLAYNPTIAEIVPDNTLPVNSSVTPKGNTRVIEGGTRRDDNLFHSFKEFSFSVRTTDTTGDTAHFNNDLTVRNIITRVTGGLRSDIDGTIKANGTANLFFINPNGIVFGRNASLQIGGSFVASTANSLKFADSTEFSATAPQTSPLLTISVPIGLQFGSNPGEIVNQSQVSPDGAVNSISSPVGLQVPSGRTLALVGGHVSLEGGNLTATGGRIELGSLAGDSFVNLREIETGYALQYKDVLNFGDIELSGGAVVDASDSKGDVIQIQGKNVTLTDNSLILSITSQSNTGGNLVINAAESVKLSGGSNIGTVADGEGRAGNVLVRALDSIELVGTSNGSASIVGSQVCVLSSDCNSVTGDGGDLMIETSKLLIRDGAAIDASTFGAGRAGNVVVKATDSIELLGTSPDRQVSSGIFAQVAEGVIENAGDAGTLSIDTKRLTVMGGAQISTAARKGGNGGNLTINASDLIQLSGTSPLATASPSDKNRSGIFVSAEPEATGHVGNLNITTGLLTIEDGARISADNFGSANREGNATLNVRQLLIQNGGEVRAGSFASGPGGNLVVNAAESVQIIGKGNIASTPVPSTLFTQAQASGKAGNLNITTRSLNVRDGAEVTVSGKDLGPAGNLTIVANDLRLNQGKLTAETNAGQGANIELQNLDLLLMQNQSQISARAFKDANGGNINIDAAKGFVVAVPGQNNDIIANAFQGNGGEINITTKGIFGIEERKATQGNTTNDIDASSEFGFDGTVSINTPDIDPNRGLIQLPVEPVNVQVAQGCQTTGTQTAGKQSSLASTGKGGLAVNPYEPLSSSNIWEDVPVSTQTGTSRQRESVATVPNKIVEAQGWVRNEKGEIFLVAEDSRCSLR
ncbi:MAG: S-layer family protein [Scytonema sp. RU_4_4]|nr:S-layer family protein [Scytonema sp. RU_4_4]